MNKKVFRMPKPTTITARTSSITNAFVNGIIPTIEPSEEEIKDALATLGMTGETICCAYCGDRYTEWDHFHPLIRNKRPTGYISEIHNLVPACGKCNQSKGNKDWRKWIVSNAALSPKTRGISDLSERIERLEEYENRFKPTVLDFEKVVGEDVWQQHWNNCKNLHKMMYECQQFSDEIKKTIAESIKENI